MSRERANQVGVLRAEIDVGDLAEADVATVLTDLDDDFAKLLRRGKPAQRVQHELINLAWGHRLLADAAGRDHHILLADRIDHFARRDVERGEFLRIEPGPHAVLPLA